VTSKRFQVNKPHNRKSSRSHGVIGSFKKIFDKIDENPFLFQVIGISILTIAILISFQSLADFSVTPVRAFDANYEVRMLTNFQANPSEQSIKANKIEEIQIAPAKVGPSVPVKPKSYVVKSGDSLYSISQEVKVSVADLVDINGIADSSKLIVGQELALSK
jgi:LysM domain